MSNRQTDFSIGDLVSTAINDLMAWHGRVLTRIFYPHLPTEVAPIVMPESAMHLEQILGGVPDEKRAQIHKHVLIVRDASAAMAAASVTGHVPDYKVHVEFQKYFQDLMAMLRGVERDLYRSAANVVLAQPAAPIVAPAVTHAPKPMPQSRDEETALQRYVRDQQRNGAG